MAAACAGSEFIRHVGVRLITFGLRDLRVCDNGRCGSVRRRGGSALFGGGGFVLESELRTGESRCRFVMCLNLSWARVSSLLCAAHALRFDRPLTRFIQ